MSFFAEFFPANPTFTEDDFGVQPGKTAVVTGACGGIGLQLSRML